MIRWLFLLLLCVAFGPRAEASSHGTCSNYPPATIYQSLSLTDGWSTSGVTQGGTLSGPTCGVGLTAVEDTSTGFHAVKRGVSAAVPATTYVLSVFVKRGVGSDNANVVVFDPSFANAISVLVDLGSCTIHSSSGSGLYLVGATAGLVNGWCQVQQTFATPINYAGLNIQVLLANGSFSNNYTGNGSSSLGILGVDLRQASLPFTIGNSTNYYSGVYTGFMQPFSGTQVTPNAMLINAPLFPGGAMMNWNYTSSPCSGVCAFLLLAYENYAGGTPAVPLTPIQVNALSLMTVSHNLGFFGVLSGFDAIYDTFLYTDPSAITRAEEVEVFLHTNAAAAAFVLASTQIGTPTISGIPWTVGYYANAGGTPDILFMPTSQADILDNTIDMNAIFAYAKTNGLITGSEWFTGLAIGVEPLNDSGTMAVNSFSALAATPIVIEDRTNYVSGVYTGFLSPFSGVELTPNTMTITIPPFFPNDVTIAWNYSSTPCVGVCAFLLIAYGDYAGGPTTLVPPVQVNNLSAATETHNLTFGGTTSGYDVIDDTFLYTDAGAQTRAEEVEVFLHTNTQVANFVAAAPSQFSTTEVISGVTWTVACYCNQATPDILFMPTNQADIPNATLDLKAMYLYAKSQGAITGNEWFTGMALGAEPQANGGSMAITSFSATSN